MGLAGRGAVVVAVAGLRGERGNILVDACGSKLAAVLGVPTLALSSQDQLPTRTVPSCSDANHA